MSPHGRLLLVPNTLDLQSEAVDIRELIPDGVLREASRLCHWVVEDARSARAFLKRVAAVHPLPASLQELHIRELPRARKGASSSAAAAATTAAADWAKLLAPALEGADIGLLSEAGLPAVADPGAGLVAAAHAAGIRVWPLAGASALLLTLAASGLDGQNFAFVGYLPQDATQRAARLRELERQARQGRQTQLFIETPYRNAALWQTMLSVLAPQTRLAVGCGLTLATGFTGSRTVADWRALNLQLPSDMPAVFALAA